MTDATQLVDRYIAMWNAEDAASRRDLVAGTWVEGGHYVDPLMEGQGHAGIDAMVAGVQERFPGHKFTRTSDVDAHNGRVRFGWALAADGQPPLVAGIDFGVLAADGRLQSITGFIDQMPG
jgi:hypothetical protein